MNKIIRGFTEDVLSETFKFSDCSSKRKYENHIYFWVVVRIPVHPKEDTKGEFPNIKT